MKHLKRFFVLVLCVLPWVAGANVATTAGSNLTAWNSNGGSANNNNWNTMMNSRSQTGSKAKADFGNCNSLILRCAQPKCAACTTMELAKPVVSGCVNSSKDCKKHGDELIEFIAAQIVANAAEKAQAQELALKQAEAQAAASQSSRQIEEMQKQMEQMQRDMKEQNAQQMEKMQAALDEQKALNATAAEQAAAAAKQEAEASQKVSGITAAQQAAVDRGVSDEVLLREQVGGEIMTAVEAAEKQLVELKATMKDIFDYAHCDSRGGNCVGPKRVKIFKEKAMKFFDPYEAIADEMYDALETALAVGVDVSDVIMMLSGSCNKWGRYMCVGEGDGEHVPVQYTHNMGSGGNMPACVQGKSVKKGYVRGGHECTEYQTVPPQDDIRCTLIGFITEDDDGNDGKGVRREWLSESYDGDKFIRVGCASSVLDTLSIFGGRRNKKARTLDLDTLQRIIEQDSYDYVNSAYSDNDVSKARKLQYCGLTSEGQRRLSKAITTKKFSQKDICVRSEDLLNVAKKGSWVAEIEGSRDIFPAFITDAYDYKSCKTLSDGKACWNGSSCMVRIGTNATMGDDACSNKSDNNNECTSDKCGKDYYWNGMSVVKAADDKDVCELRGGTWLDKTAAAAKEYGDNPCCQCSGTDENCQVEGKVCEKKVAGGGS